MLATKMRNCALNALQWAAMGKCKCGMMRLNLLGVFRCSCYCAKLVRVVCFIFVCFCFVVLLCFFFQISSTTCSLLQNRHIHSGQISATPSCLWSLVWIICKLKLNLTKLCSLLKTNTATFRLQIFNLQQSFAIKQSGEHQY